MNPIKFHHLITSKLQNPQMTAFPTENNTPIRIHFKDKENMDTFSKISKNQTLEKMQKWNLRK